MSLCEQIDSQSSECTTGARSAVLCRLLAITVFLYLDMAAAQSNELNSQVVELKKGRIEWSPNNAILTRTRRRTDITYRIMATLYMSQQEGNYYFRYSHIRYDNRTKSIHM